MTADLIPECICHRDNECQAREQNGQQTGAKCMLILCAEQCPRHKGCECRCPDCPRPEPPKPDATTVEGRERIKALAEAPKRCDGTGDLTYIADEVPCPGCRACAWKYIPELLAALENSETERAWIYNITAITNVMPEQHASVDNILRLERARLDSLRAKAANLQGLLLEVVRDWDTASASETMEERVRDAVK